MIQTFENDYSNTQPLTYDSRTQTHQNSEKEVTLTQSRKSQGTQGGQAPPEALSEAQLEQDK